MNFAKLRKRANNSAAHTRLVATCMFYLNSHPGRYAWKNNTGTASRRGFKIKFGDKGSADIIACVSGCFVGFECKTGKGRQSKDQRAWQAKIVEAGGKYFIVRSLDELKTITTETIW